MNGRAWAVAAAAALLCGAAAGMSFEEYKTQRSRVQDRFATAKERCTSVSDHSRMVCEVQARTAYDVARTELRAKYKPTPGTLEKARVAKADATYRVARAKCGDLDGSAREVCIEDAKKTWNSAKAEAQASRADDQKTMGAQKGKSQ